MRVGTDQGWWLNGENAESKSCVTVTVMNSHVYVCRHAGKIKDKHIVTVLDQAEI